jgi:DNA invertase Pin-like site-specific DNA recombinase
LSRSTNDLLEISERINNAGAGLRSLSEPWADITAPDGYVVLMAFSGIARFTKSIVDQRTDSRIADKAQGTRFGPRPALSAEKWPRLAN